MISKRKLSLVALTIVLLVASTLGAAVVKPLPVIAGTPAVLSLPGPQSVQLNWPAYGESAVGIVGQGVLATQGNQTPLPTASIAKVLTAMMVLQRKPLAAGQQGPTITIGAADIDSYNRFVALGGSVVPVNSGEVLSEYQALQALLLPSANNIAETLARWSYGSVAAFNQAANAYAAQLGMKSVQMTDPSGLAADTVASASDLTRLGELAMRQPVLAEIFKQTSATIPVAGEIQNVNFVLGRDGAVGIKTGNSDANLGAFLFAATQDVGGHSVTVVGTIMNGPSLRQVLLDSLPLIRSTFENLASVDVAKTGQVVGSYQVPWQGTVTAVATKPVSGVYWRGKGAHAAVSLHEIANGKSSAQPAGIITFAGMTADSSPIQLQQTVQPPTFWWRLRHLL